MARISDQDSKHSFGPVVAIFAVAVIVAVIFARWFFAPDHWNAASMALKRGDDESAIRELRLHLEQKPNSTKTRLRLARLLKSNSPEQALKLLKEIPDEDSAYVVALRQMAVILILQGRDAEAEITLIRLLHETPNELGPQLSLAELYFRNENFTEALSYAERAAETAPDRAQTFLLIAEIRDELHQHRKMIESLRSALAVSPDLYDAHLNLAYACQMTGRLPEAAEQADWCLERNPNEVSALRIRASVAREQGEFEQASTFLRRAMQLAPRDVDCLILHADLLLYDRKPHEAYQCLKTILEDHSTNTQLLAALARTAAAAGEREAARDAHSRLAEINALSK